MTRIELNHLLKVLSKIKNPDAQVEKAIALVNKDIANYNSRKGQFKDLYDYDSYWGNM